MSNHLAIATVTAALGRIVHAAAEVGCDSSVELEFGRPTASGDGQTTRKVQVYLYQVSTNAALSNTDLPTRGSGGNLVQRPLVALDLHYLLAFYGSQQALEPERMLGAVARELHTRPLLSRQSIEDAITTYNTELKGSNLAEAVERVRFTPTAMSLDELAKLWSVFFQTPHALSIVYQAEVVLIEAEESGPAALPVIERGEEDRGIDAMPDAQSTFPILYDKDKYIGSAEDLAADPRPRSYRNAQLGATLCLGGRNLAGDTVTVEFKHSRFFEPDHPQFPARIRFTVPAADRTATEVRFAIPNDEAPQTVWRAGLYTVSVVVSRGDRSHTSNGLPVLVAPRITSIDPPNPINRESDGSVTLTLTASPQVLPTQSATILLADREIPAQQPRTAATGTLQFAIANAPVVTDAVVRLKVDEAESIPFERTESPYRLRFADSQKVTIS